jgi:hypothetical protein
MLPFVAGACIDGIPNVDIIAFAAITTTTASKAFGR